MKPAIKFVLNAPRNPNNIGASARGMANFGFRQLAVVNPYSVAWRESKSAVNADEVMKKAKKFTSLKSAVRSAHVVVGTSAGSRRNARVSWIGLNDLRALAHDNAKAGKSMAIVFGSERSGLSNEDLSQCHYVLRIPTAKECPSMNLSQAVAVVACAIGGDSAAAPARNISTVSDVTIEHQEKLVDRALEAFTHANLIQGWQPEHTRQRLREAIYRWKLTKVDTAILHSLFRWVLKARD